MSLEYDLIVTDKRPDLTCRCVNAIREFEATHGHGIGRLPDIAAEEVEKFNGVYAMQDELLLGGVVLIQDADWITLWCGYVWPQFRGLGIYTAILEFAEKVAKNMGFRGFACWTYEFECPRIYERMGFTKGSVMRDFPKGNTSTHYYKYFGEGGA